MIHQVGTPPNPLSHETLEQKIENAKTDRKKIMRRTLENLQAESRAVASLITAVVSSRGVDSHGQAIPGLVSAFATLPTKLRDMANEIERLTTHLPRQTPEKPPNRPNAAL